MDTVVLLSICCNKKEEKKKVDNNAQKVKMKCPLLCTKLRGVVGGIIINIGRLKQRRLAWTI